MGRLTNREKGILGTIAIIILFVLASWVVQVNLEYLTDQVEKAGVFSPLIYIFIVILAVVVAPISAMPLLPLASNIWGVSLAAVYSIFGWTVGAMIAFWLARKYGVSILEKFVSLEGIYKAERLVPTENIFWSIVLLRSALPVDVLSYALGLFSNVRYRTYFWATLIGVAPFAFILSYVGTIDFYYQVTALLLAVFLIWIGYFIYRKRRR